VTARIRNRQMGVPTVTEHPARKLLFRGVPNTTRTPPDLRKHPRPQVFRHTPEQNTKTAHVSAGQRLFRLFPYYVGRGGYPPATPSLRQAGPHLMGLAS
jgi:hypothetical protein